MRRRDRTHRHLEAVDPVVVCGGGAAGMAAALAAARADVPVLLVETGPRIGGTVANAMIHTLGGIFDFDCKYLNEGLPRLLAEKLLQRDAAVRPRRIGRVWVLSVCPMLYQEVVTAWVASEGRITSLTGARVQDVVEESGSIRMVEIETNEGEVVQIQPRAVVDATGCGAIARLLREDLMQARSHPAAGGLIFTLHDVAKGALDVPKGIGLLRELRAAAESGTLSRRCRWVWLDRGVREGEVYVKLLVPMQDRPGNEAEMHRLREMALGDQAEVVSFLRRHGDFARSYVAATGALGIRDGGQVVGEYQLTQSDVLAARKFSDGACRCAWPVEYWDPENGVSLEYLPDGDYYEIPLRSLKAKGVSNLWTAGKCLSADAKAQASARVAGSCWAMGEAVGWAAAQK